MSKRTMIILFVAVVAALIAYLSFKNDQENELEPDELEPDELEPDELEPEPEPEPEPIPEPVPDLRYKNAKRKIEHLKPVIDEPIQEITDESAANITE